jgi:uncharacterized phage protein (TIGR02218 family)
MKSSLSPELLAHYAGKTTSLARLLKITRTDGAVFGFTDHVRPITFEGLTYDTLSSYDASASATKADMSVGTLEVAGLLMLGGLTAAGIEAGLWDSARADIVEVNYRDLTMGCNPLRFGTLGEAQRKSKGQYTIEIRDLNYYLQNVITRTVGAACDAVLGDARCGVDREALRVTGTVGVVTDNRQFAVAYPAPVNEETYGLGEILWVTGANAGLSMEVKALSSGVMLLQLDMFNTVAPADTFTHVPGCDKNGRLGHCKLVYSNYDRFRGFEDIPGQNAINLIGGQ